MKLNRSIEPSTKLILLLLANLFGGMLFVILFNYFIWGFAYDVIGAALGLVSIGAFVAIAVGFEIYYIWHWRHMAYRYEVTTVEYEPMCDDGNYAEKDIEYSQKH